MRALQFAISGLFSLVMFVPVAQASPATAASKAYRTGQTAQLSGDHVLAAQQFELAYGIMPSKEALRSAARARLLGDDLAMAGTHALTLQANHSDDETSMVLAKEILAAAEPAMIRFNVTCKPECSLNADGLGLISNKREQHSFFLTPGRHSIEAVFGEGRTASSLKMAAAGKTVEVTLEAPAAPASAEAPPDAIAESVAAVTSLATSEPAPKGKRKIPTMVIVGAVAVVGAAGAMLWSGIDTQNAYGDYKANPTDKAFAAGEDKQLRTNMLIGATATFGLATVAVALLTDWNEPPRERQQASIRFTGSSIAGNF